MSDLFLNPFGGGKPRVLVVDDDPDINRLLQVRLRNVGFDVRSVPDGEAALELITRAMPDLVLLDISMPGISGLEVLDHVRQAGLDVAVIMTTAFGSESVAIDALRRGADDYLRKPFEPAEFRAVIDRTVDRLQLRRQNEQLRKQLESELARASEIQKFLLPETPPEVPGYDVASICIPAHGVGGDFYDWYRRDHNTLTFTIGDVMGKGMPAALLMATVRASMRPALRNHEPAMAVGVVAEALQDDLARTRSSVSMFVGSLDVRSHVITYVDAGHGMAVVVRANGRYETIIGTDIPIGIFPDSVYHPFQISLNEGDTLLLYSDGLLNTMDSRGLEALASQTWRARSAGEAVDALVDRSSDTGHMTDDITVFVLRRLAKVDDA